MDTVGPEKEIPYETLRGLPFGHPPFFAFLALATSLAGLFDAPPILPIMMIEMLVSNKPEMMA